MMRVIILHPYTKFEVRGPSGSEDIADFRVTALSGQVTPTFDLSTSIWGSQVTRVMGFPPANFQLVTPFILDLGSGTGQTDRQTDRQRLSMQRAGA